MGSASGADVAWIRHLLLLAAVVVVVDGVASAVVFRLLFWLS